jgi:hypothetical protein
MFCTRLAPLEHRKGLLSHTGSFQICSSGCWRSICSLLHSPMRMRMTCIRYKLSEIDRVVMKTSISFDMSIFEIFWALTNGSALVIVKQREELNADSIHNAERSILKILLFSFGPLDIKRFTRAHTTRKNHCNAIRAESHASPGGLPRF